MLSACIIIFTVYIYIVLKTTYWLVLLYSNIALSLLTELSVCTQRASQGGRQAAVVVHPNVLLPWTALNANVNAWHKTGLVPAVGRDLPSYVSRDCGTSTASIAVFEDTNVKEQGAPTLHVYFLNISKAWQKYYCMKYWVTTCKK